MFCTSIKRRNIRKMCITGSSKSKSDAYTDCPLCKKRLRVDRCGQILHMCQVHYSKEISDLADLKPGARECPLCLKVFGGQLHRALLHHLASAHKLIWKVTPVSLHPWLDEPLAKEKLDNQEDPLNPFKQEKVTAKDLYYSNHDFKCPCCHRVCMEFNKLLGHLAFTHYKQDLVVRYSGRKSMCPTCQVNKENSAENNWYHWARHVGVSHHKLFLVMPDDVKAKLFEMLQGLPKAHYDLDKLKYLIEESEKEDENLIKEENDCPEDFDSVREDNFEDLEVGKGEEMDVEEGNQDAADCVNSEDNFVHPKVEDESVMIKDEPKD